MAGDDSRAVKAWLPESERVRRWREGEFLRLGFDLHVAERLASSDADLRHVEGLLARGCTHELASLIA